VVVFLVDCGFIAAYALTFLYFDAGTETRGEEAGISAPQFQRLFCLSLHISKRIRLKKVEIDFFSYLLFPTN
jgi:hypothetical protein